MSASNHPSSGRRRRLRSGPRAMVALGVLAGCLLGGPAPARATSILGVVYRRTPTVNILLDVYMPTGTGPFPAAVLVHGGNWRDGWRGDVADTAQELANRGIVAFAIDFRMPCDPTKIEPEVDPNLCSPSYHFPVPAQDVGYAVAWVRQRGSQYNAIPGRAGIVGPSSGGNLAMEVGALGTAGLSRPDAIVSWSGIGDLTWHRQNGAAQRRNYIGCSYTACPSTWVQASPSLEVGPGDAPLYLSGGENEGIIGDEQNTINRWTAQGIATQWHVVPGSTCHGRTCLTADPTIWDESVAWLYQWVPGP